VNRNSSRYPDRAVLIQTSTTLAPDEAVRTPSPGSPVVGRAIIAGCIAYTPSRVGVSCGGHHWPTMHAWRQQKLAPRDGGPALRTRWVGLLNMPGVSMREDRRMRKKEGGMAPPSDPRDNVLFAALPPEDAERLLPHLEPRTWALGDVLYDPDRAPAFLYFPTTAMVSLVHTLANGLTGEMGVVGREGGVG